MQKQALLVAVVIAVVVVVVVLLVIYKPTLGKKGPAPAEPGTGGLPPGYRRSSTNGSPWPPRVLRRPQMCPAAPCEGQGIVGRRSQRWRPSKNMAAPVGPCVAKTT